MTSKTDEEIQLSETLEFLEEVLEKEKGLKTINKYGGKGGFGLVLFVENLADPSQKYAVKAQNIINPNTGKINQTSLKMCQDEAEMMRESKHKNVVEIHSDYIIGFYHFIQMNLCKCSLNDWIEKNQSPINDILFLHYANQIIDGLEYLHNKDYVLRDLSVRNILLTTDGVIKLCDFGLAKKYDETLKSQILYTAAPKGVLFYLPPEIYEDINKNKEQIKQTKKGDIWALGICLSLLGGSKIFTFFNVHDDNFKIPQSKNISERANKLIEFILNRDPEQRPTINQIREKICEIFLNNPEQNQIQSADTKSSQPLIEDKDNQKLLPNYQIQQNLVDSASSLKIERLFDFNFVLCEKIYKKYLKFENQYQNNVDFLLTLGFLEAKYKSNYSKAQILFEKVLAIDEDETDAYFGLCHCIMQLREYKSFSKLLSYSEIILHKDPNNWRALYYKAYYYYAYQDKKSIQILEQIKQDSSECCEALSLKLIAIYYTNYEDQQELVDKIISYNKNSNPIVLFRLGSYFLDREEMQKCQHFYIKSYEITPNELSNVACTKEIFKDNEEEAKKYILKIEQLYPKNSYFQRWKYKFEKDEKKQLQYLKLSIELDPYNTWALEDMAAILKQEKKIQELIKIYEKILVVNPDYVDGIHKLAKVYFQEANEKEKAIDLYKKCIKLNPNDTNYFKELTDLYIQDDKYDEIMKIIQENLQKSNQKQYLYKLLSYIEYAYQHYDSFISFNEKSLELDPKDTFCLNMFGKYYKLIKKDFQKAKSYYEKIYEIDPKYEDVLFNLAYVEEDEEKKIRLYKKDVEANPNSVIYDNKGNSEEALKYFKQSFQSNKEDIISSSNLSKTLYDLKLYDQALEQVKVTFLLDPKHSKSFKVQADICSNRKEYKKAIENYLKVIEYDNSQDFLYKSIAYCYEELNDQMEALKYYLKHNKIYPQNSHVLYKIGYLQYQVNSNLNEAINYCKKSIELQPLENPQAYKELGLLYIKKEQFFIAKQNLLKAINQDDSYKNLYLDLSNNEKDNIKDMKQSIIYLEEYIKFDPKNQDEKINLIKAYLSEKEYIKARQLILQFIQDHPNNDDGYFQLGYLEYEQNNYLKAIVQYEKCLGINKNYLSCYVNIGLSYESLENYSKAIEFYKKSLNIDKEYAKSYYLIGLIELDKLNQPKKALKFFRKSLQCNIPVTQFKSNNNLYYIGECFIKLNYIQEAVDSFKKFLQTNPNFNVEYCQDYISKNQNAPLKQYKFRLFEDSDSDEEDTITLLDQADQLMNSDNILQAIQSYKSAFEKNPSQKTKEKLANAYLKSKQYQTALKLYQEIMKKKPKLTHLYENIAKSYEGLGEFQQAFENYKNSLKINPQSFFICHKIGYIYQKYYENSQYAKEYYLKSYNINPVGLIDNLIYLAKIYYVEKNFKESLKYFEEAYQLDSKNTEILNQILEISKIQLQDNQKYYVYLNKKVNLEKESKEQIKLLFEIADLEQQFKKYENAAQNYRQILMKDQDNNQALYRLGLNLRFLNKSKESIEIQQQLIKINPNHQLSYYEIGQIYLKYDKKPKKAIKFLRKSIELDQNHTESHYQLGLAFNMRDYKYEALQCFYQVQKLSPNFEKEFINNYILNNKNAKEKRYKPTQVDDSDCSIF